MILTGVSTNRRKNTSQPGSGLLTAAFAAVLLLVGLGGQQVNGFLIGIPDIHHGGHGGTSGKWSRLQPLEDSKKDYVRRTVEEMTGT